MFFARQIFFDLIAHDIVGDMSTFVRLCLIVPWIIQIFHKIDDQTFNVGDVTKTISELYMKTVDPNYVD